MTMAGIWLTRAAEKAFSELQAAAPDRAAAVADAINEIPVKPGDPFSLPGAPLAEPFLAKEPSDAGAPAVIYRRATTNESGEWLVVSLLNREDYRAARRAEEELAAYPPGVRELVHAVVAGTVSTFAAAPTSSSPISSGAVTAMSANAPSLRPTRE
jgi:hypothetical protein